MITNDSIKQAVEAELGEREGGACYYDGAGALLLYRRDGERRVLLGVQQEMMGAMKRFFGMTRTLQTFGGSRDDETDAILTAARELVEESACGRIGTLSVGGSTMEDVITWMLEHSIGVVVQTFARKKRFVTFIVEVSETKAQRILSDFDDALRNASKASERELSGLVDISLDEFERALRVKKSDEASGKIPIANNCILRLDCAHQVRHYVLSTHCGREESGGEGEEAEKREKKEKREREVPVFVYKDARRDDVIDQYAEA